MQVESSGKKALLRETNLVHKASGDLNPKNWIKENKKSIYGFWGGLKTMHSDSDKGGYSRLWKHGREMKDLKWLGGGNAIDNILRKDVWEEEEEEEEETFCEARGGEGCTVESTQATPEGTSIRHPTGSECSDGGSVVKHLDAMFDSIMNEIFSTPDAVNGQRDNKKSGTFGRGQEAEENQKSNWKLAASYGKTASGAIVDATLQSHEMGGDVACQKEKVREPSLAGTLVSNTQNQGVLQVESASPLEKIRQLEYKNMLRNPVHYKENPSAMHDIESGTAMFVPERPPKPGNADIDVTEFCRHILLRLKKQVERHDVGRQAIKVVGQKIATVKPKIWTLLAVAYLVFIHLLLIGSKLHGL